MISFKQYLKEYAPINGDPTEIIRVGNIVTPIDDQLSKIYNDPKLKKGIPLHITEIDLEGLVSFQTPSGRTPPPILLGRPVKGAEQFKVGDEVELLRDFTDADRHSRKKGDKVFILSDETFTESASVYDDLPSAYKKGEYGFTTLVGCLFLTEANGLGSIAVSPQLLKRTGNILTPDSILYKKEEEWSKKVYAWHRWWCSYRPTGRNSRIG